MWRKIFQALPHERGITCNSEGEYGKAVRGKSVEREIDSIKKKGRLGRISHLIFRFMN